MDWPFDQPPNCATFVTRGLIEDGKPILFVFHDEDDHGWQFHDTLDPQEEDVRIVCLSHVLKLDPGMRALADLPPGWMASRQRVSDPWVREPAPPEPDGP